MFQSNNISNTNIYLSCYTYKHRENDQTFTFYKFLLYFMLRDFSHDKANNNNYLNVTNKWY